MWLRLERKYDIPCSCIYSKHPKQTSKGYVYIIVKLILNRLTAPALVRYASGRMSARVRWSFFFFCLPVTTGATKSGKKNPSSLQKKRNTKTYSSRNLTWKSPSYNYIHKLLTNVSTAVYHFVLICINSILKNEFLV